MVERKYYKNMVPDSCSLGGCVEVSEKYFEDAIIYINNNFSSFKHNRDIFDIIFYYDNDNGNFIGYVKEYRL